MVGIRNILTKSFGSNNPVNLVKAAMDGLVKLKDAKEVARLRGLLLEELIEEPAASVAQGDSTGRAAAGDATPQSEGPSQ
jgi:hypothetical protein